MRAMLSYAVDVMFSNVLLIKTSVIQRRGSNYGSLINPTESTSFGMFFPHRSELPVVLDQH